MRVPVLCYHRVEQPPVGAELDTNFVTPSDFLTHIRTLVARGFSGVTVRDIARWQHGEQPLPPRPIAITFDDAYSSVGHTALPILAAEGWPCTVFAVSSQLGGTNAWDDHAPPAQLMTGSELRDLASNGHEIGSHSRHHRRIRGLTGSDAAEELTGSRADLESLLGAPVVSFAFPYGSHDGRALATVAAAGYRAACTLKRWANGQGANPLRIGRISIGGPLPAWQLGLKLLKAFATPHRS